MILQKTAEINRERQRIFARVERRAVLIRYAVASEGSVEERDTYDSYDELVVPQSSGASDYWAIQRGLRFKNREERVLIWVDCQHQRKISGCSTRLTFVITLRCITSSCVFFRTHLSRFEGQMMGFV